MKLINQVSIIATMAVFSTMVVTNANAKSIAAGYQHTLIIQDDSSVIGMGGSRRGAIGPHSAPAAETNNGMAPIHVGINAIDVAASFNNSAAVLKDGSVVMFGRGVTSQLSEDQATPYPVGSFTNAVSVEAAAYELFITDVNGDVFEFSYVDGVIRQLPISNIIDVDAGYTHVLFLSASGEVFAKGDNTYGQLCLGDTISRIDPVSIGITGVTSIAASKKHSLFSLSTGTVMGCGDNVNGKLGDGTEVSSNAPVYSIYFGEGVVEVESHAAGSFALMNDGTVYAWGWHNYIGNGTYNISRTFATQVTQLSNIVEIEGGVNSIMFRDANGVVSGFVSNIYGMLGDGTNTERHQPVSPLEATPLPIEVISPIVAEVTISSPYIILGTDFGDTEGMVIVEGVVMSVISWSNNLIVLDMLSVAITGYLSVTTIDGLTSSPILVTLEPEVAVIEEPIIDAPVVIEEPEADSECKRGYGYGDKNHCHSGPKRQMIKTR